MELELYSTCCGVPQSEVPEEKGFCTLCGNKATFVPEECTDCPGRNGDMCTHQNITCVEAMTEQTNGE